MEGFAFLAFREDIIALTYKILNRPRLILAGVIFCLALSAFLFALVLLAVGYLFYEINGFLGV